MDELKTIIANNIVELRKKNNMTQLELAEKLNYSDKAISKWERGDSLPDIIVLKNIADLFEVNIDYLVNSEHKVIEKNNSQNNANHNRKLILGMSSILFVLLATIIFVIAKLLNLDSIWYWTPYIYTIPCICIVSLVLNSLWFTKKRNYLIISILLWSLILAIFFTFLAFDVNLWPIFILGVPGQCIILLWSGIRYKNFRK